MICPNCGENNPENFRFCGMCGAVLAASKPATAPRNESLQAGDVRSALRIPASPPRPATEQSSLRGGPSLAGLGQAASREKGMFGAGPRFEVEEPRGGFGRKFVLVLLLAGLGVGLWVHYHDAGNGSKSAKPEPAIAGKAADSGDTLAEKAQPEQEAQPAPSAPAPPPASAAAPAVPETHAETAAKHPEGKTGGQKPRGKSKHAVTTAAATKRAAKATKDSPLHKVRAAPTAAVKPAPVTDPGEAERRKGEAYLYGRGVAKNCDAAIKNLKAASAKENARARSTFGTMYATGHCVPRDLPTSYSWFALALRADPNNQVLVKDLSAIWNQMTPPERLLATRKQ